MPEIDEFAIWINSAPDSRIEERNGVRVGIVPDQELTSIVLDIEEIQVFGVKSGMDAPTFLSEVIRVASEFILPEDGVDLDSAMVIQMIDAYSGESTATRILHVLSRDHHITEIADGTLEVKINTDLADLAIHALFSPIA